MEKQILQNALQQISEQEYDAGFRTLESYLGREPQSVEAYVGLGLIYLEQGSLIRAEECLMKAYEIYPNMASVEGLIQVYEKTNNREAMKKILSLAALEVSFPDMTRARYQGLI